MENWEKKLWKIELIISLTLSFCAPSVINITIKFLRISANKVLNVFGTIIVIASKAFRIFK